MGRGSTGAWTVYESKRIELSWLLKKGFIKKNCKISANISWTDSKNENAGNIGIVSSYSIEGNQNFLELNYTHTDREGNKNDYNYSIQFFEQPSNLGKGKILYFVCPQTFRKCRILYMAYGSQIFKSREAYRHRLYYDSQIASKLSKYNDSFWRLDSYLNKLEPRACRGERTFKGRLTKAAQRYNKLYTKQCLMEELRWTLGAPKCLKGFRGYG